MGYQRCALARGVLDGLTEWSVGGPRSTRMNPKIVVAEACAKTRGWLLPLFRPLGAQVHEAVDGAALESLLDNHGPFDLVVTSSQLPIQSGLSVLARARSRGLQTPFVVVTSVHQYLLRVFVSDAEGTVLSSRLVDGDNLRSLASSLMDRARSRG